MKVKEKYANWVLSGRNRASMGETELFADNHVFFEEPVIALNQLIGDSSFEYVHPRRQSTEVKLEGVNR